MKTTQQVIEQSGIPARLVRAVILQTGKENLRDIAEHGVNGGFSGFIYHSDTVAFFKRNRREIAELVNSMAEDLGENPVEMVCGFGCLAGFAKREDHDYNGNMTTPRRKKLAEYQPSVSRCLYGGRLTEEDTQAANALAWFAAEEVARAFCND